jgi:hypothetical protein
MNHNITERGKAQVVGSPGSWGLPGLAGSCWGLLGLAGTCWDLLGLLLGPAARLGVAVHERRALLNPFNRPSPGVCRPQRDATTRLSLWKDRP